MSRNTRPPKSREATNPTGQPNIRRDARTPSSFAPGTSSERLAAGYRNRIGQEIGAYDPPGVERAMLRYPRNPAVLDLSISDSYQVCHDKLFAHLNNLGRWIREPKFAGGLTEEDLREFTA